MNDKKQAIQDLRNGDVTSWNRCKEYTNGSKICVSDISLNGLDLSEGWFTNVVFENVSFVNSKCHGTDFRWCDFRDCDFSNADLNCANFLSSGAKKAKKTTFDEVRFNQTNLYGAEFQLSDLSDCCFEKTNLERAFLTAVRCRHTNFRGVIFKQTEFKSKKLELAKLHFEPNKRQRERMAYLGREIVQSDFTGADFTDAIIEECSLNGVFDRAEFDRAKILECSFLKTSIRNSSVSDTEFKFCRFQRAETTGTDFEEANVINCEFTKCTTSRYAQ